MHVHAVHDHDAHTDNTPAHVMHSHVVHQYASCRALFLHVTINGDTPTIAVELKAGLTTSYSDTIAPCPLPPKFKVTNWHVAELLNGNKQTFDKKRHFLLLFLVICIVLCQLPTRWSLNINLKRALPTQPYRKINRLIPIPF
jgi:hypothetical protein